jgi:hypothetical protein
LHSWVIFETGKKVALLGPIANPVGAGFVDSLAQPGGNATARPTSLTFTKYLVIWENRGQLCTGAVRRTRRRQKGGRGQGAGCRSRHGAVELVGDDFALYYQGRLPTRIDNAGVLQGRHHPPSTTGYRA